MSGALFLLASACGSGASTVLDGAPPVFDGAPPGPDAAPLPTGPLTLYGAGPATVDNGIIEPCTGPVGAGRQVLCVRAGAAGTGTAGDPLGTISAALAVARDGDVIQVSGDADAASGTYAESVSLGEYDGSCANGGVALNVSLLGGFAADFVERDARTYPTRVTGAGTSPAFIVCVLGGESTVDGFVVTTGGRSRGIVAGAGGYAGEGGTLTISHNVVFGNQPPGAIDDVTYGGGVIAGALSNATVVVSDNHVYENTSGRGAGIVAQAYDGPDGDGAVMIVRNRVERNTSRGSHGGGMYVVGPAEIAHNVVIDNELLGELGGGGWGGAFIVDGNSQRPRVEVHHNVVVGNRAASYASGEFYDEDVDATVAFEFVRDSGCVDDRRSSGLLVDVGGLGDSTVTFRNVTVIGHQCPTAEVGALVVEGGAVATVDLGVFWDNVGAGGQPLDFGIDGAGGLTVTRTVTAQGYPGTDNTTTDPAFVDPATGNYHSSAFPERGAFAAGGLSPLP